MDLKPKALRSGYSPTPFFFRQTSASGETRVIAWADSLAGQRALFEALIQLLPKRLEVLLKVKRDDEDEADEHNDARDRWQRYHGVVDKGGLLEAMARCETFVFSDSRNQLCVRNPETFDYVVLDHAGVIYIYSDDERFRNVLLEHLLEERVERLITEEAYWGQAPDDGSPQETDFRTLLRLTAVPGPHDTQDPRTIH